MSMLDRIIDADAHVSEPPDLWTSRVPRKYRDHVPHVVRCDDGRDLWTMDGRALGYPGGGAPAGWPTFPHDRPPTLQHCHPAAYDATERLKYMDSTAIW